MNASSIRFFQRLSSKAMLIMLILAFTAGLAGPTVPAAQAKAIQNSDVSLYPDGMVSGTVRDADTSLPLGGAKVEVNTGQYTYSDADGSYSISLEAGTYSVTASLIYYVPQTITDVVVDVGNTNVDFDLVHAPVTLTGEIFDSYHKLPISGAKVEVDGTYSTYTNTEGIYEFNLPPGSYSIVASANGYVTTDPIPVVLVAEKVVQDIELERILPLPVVLYGTVTDAYFLTAIQGVQISLNTGQSTTTGPSGYYSFMLDSGIYTVTVSLSGYTPVVRGPLTLTTASNREDFILYPVVCPTISITEVEIETDDLEASFTPQVSPLLSVSYLWDFGDGFTSTSATPTHAYADYGTYPISLDVVNVCDETDSWSGSVTLKEVLKNFLPMAVK